MKQKSVLVLFVLTAGALVAAALALRDPDAAASGAKERLFPELAAHINEVAELHVEKAGKVATLRREGGQWKLAERGGYPAKFEAIKQLAVGLAELDIEEQKTARKENHAKLAVEWPTTAAEGSEAGEAGLVTLKDANGKELAAAVVGKSEGRGSKPKVYVRRLSEDQVYLCVARNSLDVVTDPKSWIEPKIVELDNERVQSVSIEHADGERVEIARSATNHTQFTLQNIPPGENERSEGVASTVAQALGYGLNLEDVRPATEVDFAKEPVARTSYRCVDGLELELVSAKFEDKTWVKIAAHFTPPPEPPAPATPAENATGAEGEKPADAVADKDAGDKDNDKDNADKKEEKKDVGKEAADLNERLAPWAFAIPSYKAEAVTRRMKDLLAEPVPAAGSSAGADDGLSGAMDQMGLSDESVEPAPAPDDEEGTPPPEEPKKPE